MSDSNGVTVCCRIRPGLNFEGQQQFGIAVVDEKTVQLDLTLSRSTHAGAQNDPHPKFNFDRVFPLDSSQDFVYSHTAKPLADEVMNGFNCTIFAYGQTGSGKTFTMMGVPKTPHEGIIPRLATEIFEKINEASDEIEFTVKLSYVEIYMERIHDLLDPSKENLRIREGTRGVWIQDVTETYVTAAQEILDIMEIGAAARATATTLMNEQSSRSHSVFMMTVGQRNKVTGSKKGSKLILVDLAGSETVRKTGASGSVLEEAKHINKSLSALGNVINALTSNTGHVPYRDSKLTRLLSDSLGGNSKTCLIITCSPVASNVEETLGTMRFGVRAKKVKNTPVMNQEKSVEEYKVLLQAAVDKCAEQEELIAKLKAEIVALREVIAKNGINIDNLVLTDLRTKEEQLAKVVQSASSPAMLSPPNPEDEDGPDDGKRKHTRRSSAMMENLELQGQLSFLERQVKDKEDALVVMQEELEQKERELYEKERLIDEMTEALQQKEEAFVKFKEEQANQLPDPSISQKLEEHAELTNKVALLEKENADYQQRMNQLTQSNLEFLQLQEVHQHSLQTLHERKDSSTPPGSGPASFDAERHRSRTESGLSDGYSIGSLDTLESKLADSDKKLAQLKANYDVLMSALGRKCEQYISLQVELNAKKDQLLDFERKLATDQRTAAPANASGYEASIQDLHKRLKSSDELCHKLYHSGLYWQKRGQRKEEEVRTLTAQLEQLQKFHGQQGFAPPDSKDPNGPRAVGSVFKGPVRAGTTALANGSFANARFRTQSQAKIVVPVHVTGGRRSAFVAAPHEDEMDQYF